MIGPARWTSRLLMALSLLPLVAPWQEATAQARKEPARPERGGWGTPPIGLHVEVSLRDRLLWVIAGSDTLRVARVAVASGGELVYSGRRWRFETPRGGYVIRAKRADPIWTPPDWHYAEVAQEHRLAVRGMSSTGARLRDGRRLIVRDAVVGLIAEDGVFHALPVDEHVVFDSVLYIPPATTHNRRLIGELGKFALDMGNGYLLHGTRDTTTVGAAVTHGCIRLGDNDLAWLFEWIPVGTRVIVR